MEAEKFQIYQMINGEYILDQTQKAVVTQDSYSNWKLMAETIETEEQTGCTGIAVRYPDRDGDGYEYIYYVKESLADTSYVMRFQSTQKAEDELWYWAEDTVAYTKSIPHKKYQDRSGRYREPLRWRYKARGRRTGSRTSKRGG